MGETHTFSMPLPRDGDGFLQRQCPGAECEKVFKVKPGTGLTGPDLECVCPYCGQRGAADTFHTKNQVEHVQSVVHRVLSDHLYGEFKKMEFKTSGPLSFSLKVTRSGHVPIHPMADVELETKMTCEQCTLEYVIYGVFGFCPDCGAHNSFAILKKNLDVVRKMLALASAQPGLDEALVANALGSAVAAFDGFGREACRVHVARAKPSPAAGAISFQNLIGARRRVREQFGVDFAADVDGPDWAAAARCFQKRHLLAHKLGVVDESYLAATEDTDAVLGRKVVLGQAEVARLCDILERLGMLLIKKLEGDPS